MRNRNKNKVDKYEVKLVGIIDFALVLLGF